MIKTVILSLLVAAPLTAVPAAAASNDGQTTALVTARDSDVRSAEALTRIAPKDGGAYIELAQAYVRADRPADAAAAYRRALVLDNEMMETKTGDSIWSHQVAKSALDNEIKFSAR